MRFQVPQNVQREDTIIGPLTLKQLIIATVGLGVGWIMWKTLSPAISTPLIIVLVALTICMLFVRINEMPFYQFLAEALLFLLKPRMRSWQKGKGDISVFSQIRIIQHKKKDDTAPDAAKKTPMRSLKSLSNTLDTRGRWNTDDAQTTTTQKEVDTLSDAEFFERTMGK